MAESFRQNWCGMALITKSNQESKAMAEDEDAAADQPARRDDQKQVPDYAVPSASKGGGGARPGGGFFTIYKKGQGYWTRMGTAIGAGILGAVTAYSLYIYVPVFFTNPGLPVARRAATIVSLSFLAIYSAFAFWYMNRPKSVEFLIATDSEMKKVNWTTKGELIGSTKIVIIFMFLIATFLFLIDQMFWFLFWLIGVLKASPFGHGTAS